ncbi:HEPN domain-containing protein [Methylorubrum rhodesianum]|uniref:HEPN domain-containing protein n=1 Tax=Methylorubrum rhodesianum TaxID=29427 RepID=UPI003D042C91
MSQTPDPSSFMRKAERALASARVLLHAGDAEGACNRAYYAMFDAARAALMLLPEGTAPIATIKTHRGLIMAFGQYLVATGRIDPAFGRSLNQVEKLRLSSDYFGDVLPAEDGLWAVEQAETFVNVVKVRLPEL